MKTFEKRFEEILSRITVPSTAKLWGNALFLSLGVTVFFAIYIILQDSWNGLESFNRVISNAAMVMVGLSFIASSVCYFWDFADRYIIYRKYWGLVGFWLVCVHGFVSLAQKEFDLGFFLLPQNLVAFLCALGAFLILLMMALISNVAAVKKLGGKRWRAALRVGYLAYVLAIVHIAYKAFPQWTQMMGTDSPLPPLSLVVVLFGFIVIFMRLALTIALGSKKNAS